MASWLPGRPEEGEMTQTMPAAIDGTTVERLTVPRSIPRRRSRRFAAAAAVAVVGLLLYSSAAHATPGKSSQWITLTGTCDGIPVLVLDPPGPGPTGFSTLTGKMGVGRLFQSIYVPTRGSAHLRAYPGFRRCEAHGRRANGVVARVAAVLGVRG